MRHGATMSEKRTAPHERESVSRESILKVSKEVAIKFIETGRVTPATFEDTFTTIYTTIQKTVEKA